MLSCSPEAARGTRRLALMAIVPALVFASSAVLNAQIFSNQRSVGGIAVDVNGVLSRATLDDQGTLSRIRIEGLAAVPGGLGGLTELRKVSLRAIEAAIEKCLQTSKDLEDLPDEIKYLAGLQQIRYIFVYPQQRDIVLVGPGEGWKVDSRGYVIGITTGRPVMLLDDLLVALQSARQAANGGISCSIDPTAEGLVRYSRYMGQFRRMGNPQMIAAGGEKALGPQNITLTNVSSKSHFARVLVAADYAMKRLGMGFERAPIGGLPSYVQMASATGSRNAMPRWWLEPNYDPLLRSPDGLAWELPGGSVKAMTEDAFLAAAGNLRHTGKTSPTAQRWADIMTEKYDELALANPVFGQLRNCMELAIVGALIVKERLPEKAGYSMPTLLDATGLKTEEFFAPKQVDSKVGMTKKGRTWTITASGGVMLNSWNIADKVRQSDAPAQVRDRTIPAENANWWWN